MLLEAKAGGRSKGEGGGSNKGEGGGSLKLQGELGVWEELMLVDRGSGRTGRAVCIWGWS